MRIGPIRCEMCRGTGDRSDPPDPRLYECEWCQGQGILHHPHSSFFGVHVYPENVIAIGVI